MKTEEQIRQDIIREANYALQIPPTFEEVMRRIEERISKDLGIKKPGRLKRVINRRAMEDYKSQITPAMDSDESAKRAREYNTSLVTVRDAAKSGVALQEIYRILEDYEKKGWDLLASGFKAIYPEILEQRLRTEYLDMPVEQVRIQPSHTQHSLFYLLEECRRHSEMRQSELTEKIFDRLKKLYQHVYKSSVEKGVRPIVAVYPGSGGFQTADQAVENALNTVARAKAMNESEINDIIRKLRGDVDISKIDYGNVILRVV